MLKGALGFEQQTLENKLFIDGYAVVKSADDTKFIITAWEPVQRTWGNEKCPCLHSDPQFLDCPPERNQMAAGLVFVLRR